MEAQIHDYRELYGKSQSVKWLALFWIMEFESFKGRIFSVCRTIYKGSELHPSSSQ